MEIYYRTRKLAKICDSKVDAVKKHGRVLADILHQRLMELKAAENLSDMLFYPRANTHELKHNRKGQISVDVEHPYRLLFIVANDPIPVNVDGSLDWDRVTAIEIIEIVDTHTGR